MGVDSAENGEGLGSGQNRRVAMYNRFGLLAVALALISHTARAQYGSVTHSCR